MRGAVAALRWGGRGFEAWRSRLERAAFRISLVGIGLAVQTYAGVLPPGGE